MSGYLERVRFNRVFDIVRHQNRHGTNRYTEFSFEANSRCVYAVKIGGWPTLREGDQISAVLEKPGDWQTLAGWRNHDANEVAKPKAFDRGHALGHAFAIAAFLPLMYLAADSPGLKTAVVAYGLMVPLLLGNALYRVLRERRQAALRRQHGVE